MNSDPVNLSRSVLYYPTIKIPSRSWLKQSLLYWDQVSSIVPADRDGQEKLELDRDMLYLIEEQEFKPVFPEQFLNDSPRVGNFERELVETLDSSKFQGMLPPPAERSFLSTIHKVKMNYEILELLRSRGLIENRDIDIYGSHRRWIRVEDTTALIYMGILAKHIGWAIHSIPGTDQAVYEDVIFSPLESADRKQAAQISLRKLLPIPSEFAPVQDIVAFKRTRRDELMRFRQEIDEINYRLNACEREDDVHETLIHFDEKIQQGKKDLARTLEEHNLLSGLGTLNVIVGISASAAAGWAASLFFNDPIVGAATFFGSGAVQLGNYWVSQKFSQDKTLRDSPYSYLYYAEQDHMTTPAPHPYSFA